MTVVYVDWLEKVKILQKAVIKNNEGLILALKRTSDRNRPRPNCWDLVGGRVEVGDIEKWGTKSGKGDNDDILINALRREITEETNLDVVNVHFSRVASGFDGKRKIFTVAIGYTCDSTNEDELELSPEHCEYKWTTQNKFLNLEIGDDGGLIESIIKSS